MLKKDTLGFSLVEIALVLVLVGIFLRFGVGALSSLRTHSAVQETRQKQDKIRDALVTYLSNNQRLPCPDTNPVAAAPSTGRENRVIPPAPPANSNSPCSDSAGVALAPGVPAIGVLPFAALGLSRDDALDGWDNFFTYEVSLDIAATLQNEDWSVNPSPPGVPFAGSITAKLGSIQINTRNAAGLPVVLNDPTPPPPAVGQGSIAVIISHGPNGLGAFTTKGTRNTPPPAGTDELDNTDLPPVNSIFFRREFTDVAGAPGGTFDDIVRDFTTVDLLTPVIKVGALQSATAQVVEQLRTIRDTAFGQVPFNVPPPCFPPANLGALFLPPTITVDPWGQPINYLPATAPVVQLQTFTPAGTAHAFCVWSFGPDGVNNSVPLPPPNCPAIAGDDVGLAPVTYGQLRAAYSVGIPPVTCP